MSVTLKFRAPGQTIGVDQYDLDYPSEFAVYEDISAMADHIDIVGGTELREITLGGLDHVVSMALSTPPGSPAFGAKYVVNPTGTGAWAGHDNEIATWLGSWGFETPITGRRVINDADGDGYEYDGAVWGSVGPLTADFLPPENSYVIEPQGTSPPFPVAAYPSGVVVMTWRNYQLTYNRRHDFNHAAYEAHGCGRNIRRKDKAKPLTGSLLIKRDRQGNYTETDSECAIQDVPDIEGQSIFYSGGARIDPDRVSIESNRVDPPGFWTHVVQCETRKAVSASNPQSALPVPFRVPVFRDEFVHQSRESTRILAPMELVWTVGGSPLTSAWTVTPATALPTGAVWDYPLTFTGLFSDPGGIPPFDFTMTMPAGVVVDGIGPLTEVKDYIEPEIGRIPVNCEGEFPAWKFFEVGTKITTSDVTWNLTGQEVVAAVHFDADRQKLGFAATNALGGDAAQLAQVFIDIRRYRTWRQ